MVCYPLERHPRQKVSPCNHYFLVDRFAPGAERPPGRGTGATAQAV